MPKRVSKDNEAHYVLNKEFEFFDELMSLVLKSSPAENDEMISKIGRIGRVKLLLISGIFINKELTDTNAVDLFIVVDDVDKRKFNIFLKGLEAEIGKEIRFTLMEKDEFQYRLSMFDRFIRIVLENPHEKLINKLSI